MGNCEAIVGKASEPSASVKTGQFFHEVDLIDPTWVTDLFNGPEENPFGAGLRWFSAEKDAHWRLRTRGHAVLHPKHHTLRLRAHAKQEVIPHLRQKSRDCPSSL
jgi:hypothetical protein